MGFGLAGMIASIFVRFLPVRWFRRINIFQEADIKEDEMDQTLPSRLRRLRSVSVGSICDEGALKRKSLARKESIYKN